MGERGWQEIGGRRSRRRSRSRRRGRRWRGRVMVLGKGWGDWRVNFGFVKGFIHSYEMCELNLSSEMCTRQDEMTAKGTMTDNGTMCGKAKAVSW